MKNFKYKFSRIMLILLFAGIVLGVACIALNVVRIVNVIKSNTQLNSYDTLSIIISIALSVSFIIFAISALARSYYEITEKGVLFKCGFVKTKIDASEIKEIKYEYEKNKLELVFLDESYFVIAIELKEYEKFIDEFHSKFKNIPYIQITEPKK